MSLPEKGIDCPNGLLLWELGKLLLFIFYYFYFYFLGGGKRMQNVCSENRILRSNRQSLLIYKKEEGKTGQGLRAVPAELMCKQVAGTAGWSPLQQVLLLVFVWARKEEGGAPTPPCAASGPPVVATTGHAIWQPFCHLRGLPWPRRSQGDPSVHLPLRTSIPTSAWSPPAQGGGSVFSGSRSPPQ